MCIDVYGVGTRLITSADDPALGGVYKMSAEVINGEIVPKIKLSDNPVKVTNPGLKKVFRLYGKDGMAAADLIALEHEALDPSKPLRIYHPIQTYKSKVLSDFTVRELLVPVFVGGKQVYRSPDIHEIRAYADIEFSLLWDEYKRLLNPHEYKVDLSDALYDLKKRLISEHVRKNH